MDILWTLKSILCTCKAFSEHFGMFWWISEHLQGLYATLAIIIDFRPLLHTLICIPETTHTFPSPTISVSFNFAWMKSPQGGQATFLVILVDSRNKGQFSFWCITSHILLSHLLSPIQFHLSSICFPSPHVLLFAFCFISLKVKTYKTTAKQQEIIIIII